MAFCASRPAAIITDGFEVFVHDVIDAITTEPSSTCVARASFSSSTAVACVAFTGAGIGASFTGFGPASPATGTLPATGGISPTKDCHTRESGTRSCGRRGPATLDSTLERSTSMSSSYVGVTAPLRRNMPCAFVYCSTSGTSSPRPVCSR